jgi:hypothetical protein
MTSQLTTTRYPRINSERRCTTTPGTPHSFANRTGQPVRFLAHASHASHKAFLCELFEMAQEEPAWPPVDPRPYLALGERYDSVYLQDAVRR